MLTRHPDHYRKELLWLPSAAQGLAEIQIRDKEEIMSMKTGDSKLFVSRDHNEEISACVFVFQFDGGEVISGYENAKNGEKEGIALMQAWERDLKSALRWCGNFHPGGNGTPPANILGCGGAVCILFGGMRLLSTEEEKRSKKRKAEEKEAKEAKKGGKKTKRKRSAGSTAKFLEQAQCSAQARAAAGAPALVGE